mmetsp:Transcript_35875/g.46449  ORF Transcript_35875/g.46449 Transcript_35875/m.46449 type:complete len:89 (+) Transcript_35875:95-361(+)
MTNFSSPQQLKTSENSLNTPLNRLPLYKTPLRTANKGEHPIEISRSDASDQKSAESTGEFFNRIAPERPLAMSPMTPGADIDNKRVAY